MKKIKLNSSALKLKKETIAKLSNEQMGAVFGGVVESTGLPCTNSGAEVCNPQSGTCTNTNYCSIGCPPSADCTRPCTTNMPKCAITNYIC